MTPHQLNIVCALVVRAGRLLISRRREGSHLAGFWEFPGGKSRPDEDDLSAVRRELMEEVGLEVQVGALYFQTTFTYPERVVNLKFFGCTVDAEAQAAALEVAAFAWVKPEQLSDYPFPPANQELLALLQAGPLPG